ncbi:type-F conjugative transfer system pilin assembly protein TrbC [Hydrogenophaga pseudoflava]|uniref:Type-F conjugative transfer system pilin assembly protein n=1 Tax=Hydrogenophaga pseudoflava TaxID=47421 RepID=A0A4P6X0J0_HYDPS|nr:type-F conjugative transfer system pilin assembly protein TrbC [Hydrogenophaga pseudoflava]MCM2337143.1 type-F conjugative transfer system pilin assembly protein TrbC [Lysobacter sp.]QBM28529.1 Type-F conjugative transfer system pilin assembly protein [Hydrogenophaga pseudoflava]
MSATDLSTFLRRALTSLLAAGAMPTAWAAGPAITEADIERARRAQPTVTEQDIEQARRKHSRPPIDIPASAPATTGPTIDALPQPVTRTPIDLEALARGYASQTDAMEAAQGLAKGPGLFVFVSLAMPRPTLQRLIDQAARARASVILRGLTNGSLRQTVAQVQPLIGQRQVAVQIDPQAFDRFAIARVPSFVLVRDGTRPESCAAGRCAPPEAFLRTAGDVSLDYSLEHMQRAAPAFRADAAPFLARLRN